MKCCSSNNNNNKHIWKVTYTFIAKENTHFKESFGLILQNRKLICVIGTVQSYLGFWWEIEFWYYRCRNSTKSMRENKKKVERKNVEFRQRWYRISFAQFCCPCVECPKWKGKNKNKKIDKRIVAMLLPK